MDWENVEKKFRKLLLAEGYELTAATELAFYIRQNLENAEPLLTFAKEADGDQAFESEAKIEESMEQVHMLLSNPENMRRAYRILLFKDPEE